MHNIKVAHICFRGYHIEMIMCRIRTFSTHSPFLNFSYLVLAIIPKACAGGSQEDVKGPHAALAVRLSQRDPGRSFVLGQRLQYVLLPGARLQASPNPLLMHPHIAICTLDRATLATA